MAKTPKAGERRMASFRLPVTVISTIRQIGANSGLSATDVVVLAVSSLAPRKSSDEPLHPDDQLDLFSLEETPRECRL